MTYFPGRFAQTLAAVLLLAACAPRVPPLTGTPAPAHLPPAELRPVHQQIVFDWEYADIDFRARGEGVARVAPPDSARLDLFVAGGFGGGHAWLIADSVISPGGPLIRRFIPPPPLMWASLGRLALPPARDTVARLDGDTLRADIGRSDPWRVTFAGDRLVRVERIAGSRIAEWVDRSAPDQVRYRNESARRSLTLTIRSWETVPPFDASIWPW